MLTKHDWIALACFGIFTSIQVLLLCATPFSLSADELQYLAWSKELDWAYYSKGPLIALLIRATTSILGDSDFAVRFSALLCYSLLSLWCYLFLRRITSPTTALWGFLGIRMTPVLTQTGFLVTPDAPLALLWLLACCAAYSAIIEGKQRHWIGFGLSSGLAVWAKYTAVSLPLGLISYALLVDRSTLRLALKGSLLCAVLQLPLLIWNFEHGWANLRHNSSHVFAPTFRPQYLVELLGGQLSLIGPLLLPACILVIVREYRSKSAAGLFAHTAIPLLLILCATALTKRVYANWPLPIAISGLLALCLSERPPLLRYRRQTAVCNALLTVVTYLLALGATFGLPGAVLPTKKLVGFSDIGARLAAATVNEEYLLCDAYGIASAAARYDTKVPLLLNLDDRRMTQFDIWQRHVDWQSLVGKDVVLAVKSPQAAATLTTSLDNVTELPDSPYTVSFAETEVRKIYVYRARVVAPTLYQLPRHY